MSNNYIVLIEDNEDDIELTKLAFKKNNFANEMITLKDGEEALNFFFNQNSVFYSKPDKPVFILLDLKLPKVNGLDILKELKSNKTTKFIPVIILTSSQEEDDIISGYDLGANSYVRKPVDYQKFVEVVNNLGVYWMAVNQPPFLDD